MPYSVPPSPPPIVNYLSPEESSHSVSSSIFAPLTEPSSSDASPAVATSPSESVTPCASQHREQHSEPSCATETAPANEPGSSESLESSVLSAEPLGTPLTVDRFTQGADRVTPTPVSRLGASWNVAPGALTFSQLPEVAAIAQGGNEPSAVSVPSAPPISTTPSHLPNVNVPATSSPSNSGTGQRSDQPEGNDGAQMSPTTLPTEPIPTAPDLILPRQNVQPSGAGAEPVPASPAPANGEVLTIPERRNAAPSNGQADENSGQGGNGSRPGRRNPRRGEAVPIDREQVGEVLQLTADRQEYNQLEQTFEAEGHVTMRFRNAVLTADQLRVNIPDRFAVAEGNAALTRGRQVLRGDRFEYNFGLNNGTILGARGELFLPGAPSDFAQTLPTDVGAEAVPNQSVGDQVAANQPFQVTGGTTGVSLGVNTPNQIGVPQQGGSVNRLRYQADRIDFESDGNWEASNLRITNDPFSPPELELRTNRATFTRETPTRSVLRTSNPRLVFDQGFSLPLLIDRYTFDSNRRRNPGIVQFGYDERDRGGFYISRPFDIPVASFVSLTLSPELYVQRAFDERGINASDIGLTTNLDVTLSSRTTLASRTALTGFDLDNFTDRFRASIRLRQQVFPSPFTHTVALEYSYRDRLFNGSLGFQTVQSSVGFVITSPTYLLGNSGIYLSYQAGVQYINAATDQQDLLPDNRADRDLNCIDPDQRDTTGNGCVSLVRYQTSAALLKTFYLWRGTALPYSPTEGVRYTPYPLTPYLAISLGTRGVFSGYSSGDTQASLTGTVTLSGQFGHFSRPFFDYTAFRISYSNTALDGSSPFFFDRVADQEVLNAGITQQIYGPVRAGVQTSINLQTGDEIDTVYTLEYSRRTYSLVLSYSPKREAGSLGLRVSDFNWSGDPGPFSGIGSSSVTGGVRRLDN